MIEYPHATDPPRWWCTGTFDEEPVGRIGVGHPGTPNGWPVYRCLDCGDALFLTPRPADEEAKIRALAAAAA